MQANPPVRVEPKSKKNQRRGCVAIGPARVQTSASSERVLRFDHKEKHMQVLLHTRFGNLLGWAYEAGVPDSYGNSNEPVVTDGDDGPYCHVFFPA